MGHGTVSKPLQKQQGEELMVVLSKEYEKLQTLGYGDLVLQEKLQECYRSHLEQHPPLGAPLEVEPQEVPVPVVTKCGDAATITPAPAPAPAPAAAPALRKPAGSANAKRGGSTKKPPGPTRRRSFEAAAKPTPAQALANSTLLGSASEAILPPTDDASTAAAAAAAAAGAGAGVDISASTETGSEATTTSTSAAAPGPPVAALPSADPSTRDNWDSVSDQPYCDVCKTAFKSAGLLDRHIKYSELHAKNVVTAEAAAAAAAIEEGIRLSPDVQIRKTVEGQDYKMLYSGSKFFWRSQDNIDLTFFQHFAMAGVAHTTEVLEIVPFCPKYNKSFPRVYLDMQTMTAVVKADLASAKLAQKNKTVKSKFTQPKSDDAELLRKTLTTAILGRLQLQDNAVTVNGTGTSTGRAIAYCIGVTDKQEKSPLLDSAPPGLVPVSVTHRRNTSTEEVKAKMADLKTSQAELAMATRRAENVINHVQSFSKRVKKEFLARQAMSLPRKRWVMAINRVLQINGVAKTTVYLAKLVLAQEEKAKGSLSLTSVAASISIVPDADANSGSSKTDKRREEKANARAKRKSLA